MAAPACWPAAWPGDTVPFTILQALGQERLAGFLRRQEDGELRSMPFNDKIAWTSSMTGSAKFVMPCERMHAAIFKKMLVNSCCCAALS
jgi:hypothetical protein